MLPHTKKLKNIRFRCYRKCSFYETNKIIAISAPTEVRRRRYLNNRFEAYGGKSTITIPAGGTVTLRPKVTVLAQTGTLLPNALFSVTLTAITFDIVK